MRSTVPSKGSPGHFGLHVQSHYISLGPLTDLSSAQIDTDLGYPHNAQLRVLQEVHLRPLTGLRVCWDKNSTGGTI